MYINTQHAIATFPQVIDCLDYHDIDYLVEDLNGIFRQTSRPKGERYKQVRGSECGFCENALYWGVLYIGHKPSKAVIDQLLADAGYIPSETMED